MVKQKTLNKKSKTNDIIRRNWFYNIVSNLNMVNIDDETIGGYFPECLYAGDNCNLVWFDKILTSLWQIIY